MGRHLTDHDPLPGRHASTVDQAARGIAAPQLTATTPQYCISPAADRHRSRPRHLPEDTESRAGLWRDRTAGYRVLLVLDNAASSTQVAPLLPGGDGSLVLVTSRRHLADLPGGAVPVLLGTLTPVKAQEMFLLLAPRAAGSAAEVAELVGLAGCLPLAISLLARVSGRHPSWTLANLIAETGAKMLTLAAEASTVAAAFEVSYQNLAPRQQEFFRRLGLHPGTTIAPYGAAALADAGLDDAAEQLDAALRGEGLLTETGYRRHGMHDLIRRYAWNLAAADPASVREQAMEGLLDYYQQTALIAEARLAFQTHTRPVTAAAAPEAALPDLPDRARAIGWARSERAGLLGCLAHVAGADAQALNSSSDWRCASPGEPRGSAAFGYRGCSPSPVGAANR